jgi:ribosomal protein L34E
VLGVDARKRHRGAPPGFARRTYLLRGLLRCAECGGRLHGTARVSRGREWRYYSCLVRQRRSVRVDPGVVTVECHSPSISADVAEAHVLRQDEGLTLPDEAIRLAREELRRRLRKPHAANGQRYRLTARRENLRKQHEWGDISDETWRAAKFEIETKLASLPDDDKLVLFDRQREILLSAVENVRQATPEQLQRLLATLVERVEVADGRVISVVSTAPARPFFAAAEADECVASAPPERFELPTQALGRPRSIL